MVVVTSQENGTSDRRTLRKPRHVAQAIGPATLSPVDADLLELEPEVDLPDLLTEIRIAADADLAAPLRMIGEAGYPETIKLLLGSLRQRTEPISPRAAVAAEAAVAKIRERYNLADSGTLAITDGDEAGQLAVAREAGTLALPPRDPSR